MIYHLQQKWRASYNLHKKKHILERKLMGLDSNLQEGEISVSWGEWANKTWKTGGSTKYRHQNEQILEIWPDPYEKLSQGSSWGLYAYLKNLQNPGGFSIDTTHNRGWTNNGSYSVRSSSEVLTEKLWHPVHIRNDKNFTSVGWM